MEKLKKEEKWDELLDRLKENYIDDDPGEEIQRLQEFGILTTEINDVFSQSVYALEKHKAEYAVNSRNQEYVKAAIGRALEIRKFFGDKFFVLVSAQDTPWAVVNYLNKEIVRHKYPAKETHNYKFLRIPRKDKVPNDRYKRTTTHDHDPETRRALASCDIEFIKNINPWESTLHFLSNSRSVYAAYVDAARNNIREAFPGNYTLETQLMDAVNKYTTEIQSAAFVGTLHVMMIPKDRATEGSNASLYRAHPYGRMCDCPSMTSIGERGVLEGLQKDTLTAKCKEGNTQYRALLDNFEPKKERIITITTIGKEKRHEIKATFRKHLDAAGYKAKGPSSSPVRIRKSFKDITPPSKREKAKSLEANNVDEFNPNAYFENIDKMNRQAKVTDLRANILLGPPTPGFFDKVPMPFCAVTLQPSDLKRIKVDEETPFGLSGDMPVPLEGTIKQFDYDPSGAVREIHRKKTMKGRWINRWTKSGTVREEIGLELTFSALLSKRGEVNLSESDRNLFKIHKDAKYFYFVKPIDALGEYLAYEAKRELESAGLKATQEQIEAKKKQYIGDIIATLTEQYGADFAALMYIGGYAYFNGKNELIQTKALVGQLTQDVLPVKRAQRSKDFIPEPIRREFNESVKCITTQPNCPKDGNSTQVTSPELLSYDSTHFDWVPPGYIPAAAQDKISKGDKALAKQFADFYATRAPHGFFMYKFKDTANDRLKDSDQDCFLAIGMDEVDTSEGSIGNVTILRGGKPEKVQALVQANCIVGGCREKTAGAKPAPSNVVWKTRDQKYRQVCCSECNRGMTAAQRERFYRQPVDEQFDTAVHIESIKDQFYECLYLNLVADYKNAKLAEMSSTKKYSASVITGAPENAETAQFLYPAENLALGTDDPQLKNLYQVGGYAYYDKGGNLIGIHELKLTKESGSKEMKFDSLQEVIMPEALKEKVLDNIKENKMPLVTLKSLRARGVRYFMEVPPGDPAFPSVNGMFLYFTEDGSKAFAKARSSGSSSIAAPVSSAHIAEMVNKYFCRPYKDTPSNYVQTSIAGKLYTVQRPNHPLAHGLRQGFLAVDIIDALNQLAKKSTIPFKSDDGLEIVPWVKAKMATDPNFLLKVEMASAYQRTGRESEVDRSIDEAKYNSYERIDAVNFAQDVRIHTGPGRLFKDAAEAKVYGEAILWSTASEGTIDPLINRDLYFLRKVFHAAHDLDLKRVISFDSNRIKASTVEELFGTATIDKSNWSVNPGFAAEEQFILTLWRRSEEYLRATGDREIGVRNSYADHFYLLAQEPKEMVKALQQARNRTPIIL